MSRNVSKRRDTQRTGEQSTLSPAAAAGERVYSPTNDRRKFYPRNLSLCGLPSPEASRRHFGESPKCRMTTEGGGATGC